MKQVWIIFQTEVLDNIRDTRSLVIGVFFSALFGPLMLGALLLIIGSSFRKDLEKPLNLPVQNPEYAPTLIRFLESHDVIIAPAPADPQAAVKVGDVDVVLVIPETFSAEFSASTPATVQLVLDSSRQSSMINILRIQTLLDGYNAYLGKLRLVVRGVSPDVTDVIAIDKVDVATPETRVMILFSMLPYFIIFGVFSSSSSIIVDSTAGERERKSLEPLLINPVPRRIFVFGKILSSFPFSIANLALTLLGFWLVFNLVPLEKYLGMQIGLNGMTLLWIFLICLPVIYLASAIQIVAASFARTSKEAGNYVPFIALIPSLPGLALAFFPVKSNLWLMLIPTFGQQLLINQLLRLEPVSVWNIIASVLATLLVSVIFTWLAVLLYKREQVMFRGG